MSELSSAIVARLAADPALTGPRPGALGFRVWGQWLVKAEPTRDAFDATSGRLLRSIVVLDPGEVAHPSPRPNRRTELWDAFPTVYLFAETHPAGHAAIEAADRLIRARLHGWEVVVFGTEHVSVEALPSRTGVRDDESFSGNIRTERRFRATGARALAIAS